MSATAPGPVSSGDDSAVRPALNKLIRAIARDPSPDVVGLREIRTILHDPELILLVLGASNRSALGETVWRLAFAAGDRSSEWQGEIEVQKGARVGIGVALVAGGLVAIASATPLALPALAPIIVGGIITQRSALAIRRLERERRAYADIRMAATRLAERLEELR